MSRITGLLADEEYRELQRALIREPRNGDLIPGGRGLRKMRWYSRSKRRGKRGGMRVIYYVDKDRIYMVYVYEKSRQGDMSKSQLKAFAEGMRGC